MLLSVIIVNYNVKYFLEQCLFSVLKAGRCIPMEVIVVDNNSTDGSAHYIQATFPQVRYHVSKENMGFAKACNYGLQLSLGTYILFLNPDTILPEDSLEKCVRFLNSRPNAGALGVRMLDGSGNFLKESKRGNPTLLNSFFKLSGISSLFPRSAFFSGYYMAHLDEHSTSAVPVLSGAFMMMHRNVPGTTGSFDEQFFMYGEDIDLSYRIQKAGFINYYFPEVSIIHFKGESTQKESYQYVHTFYNAMIIFVKKHYRGSMAFIYRWFIKAGIFLFGATSFISKKNHRLMRSSRSPGLSEKSKDILLSKNIALTGSPEAMENTKKIAENAGFTIAGQHATGSREYPVAYCEGEKMSFKDIIRQWDEQKPQHAMIYASGSKSIVGSPGKDTSGELITAVKKM